MTNRTESQRAASRRNGAKSRGPKTPEGRAASARRRHHSLGLSVLIAGESPAEFARTVATLERILQPQDPFEGALVEMMATCQWRQTRLLEMERAALLIQKPDPEEGPLDPASRGYRAFQSANADRSLDAINRQAARLDHQYHQSLQALVSYRRDRPRIEPEDPSNPNKTNNT